MENHPPKKLVELSSTAMVGPKTAKPKTSGKRILGFNQYQSNDQLSLPEETGHLCIVVATMHSPVIRYDVLENQGTTANEESKR